MGGYGVSSKILNDFKKYEYTNIKDSYKSEIASKHIKKSINEAYFRDKNERLQNDLAVWADKSFLDKAIAKLRAAHQTSTEAIPAIPTVDVVALSKKSEITNQTAVRTESPAVSNGVKIYMETTHESKPTSSKLGKKKELVVAEYVDENGRLNRVEFAKKRNQEVKPVAHYVLHPEGENAFIQVPVGHDIDSPKRIGIRVEEATTKGPRVETLWRHNEWLDSASESIRRTSREEVETDSTLATSVSKYL
jgi:hypothetical protein